MEVRNRKKSFGSSTTTISDEMYTSKNNYGFSKASKKTYEENYSVMSNPSDPQPLRGHDQYMDESEIQYPDNIGTFADGLKGDIFELFETGAKVLNKSFKLLLPFGSESYGSGTVDVMKDIEIRSPLANVTNRSNSRPVQAATRTVSKSPFKTAEDAIRMRCSSMWKKEAPINGASEPFLPMPRKDLFPSQGPNMRVKEGVRVQLNKLSSGSGSIQVSLTFY